MLPAHSPHPDSAQADVRPCCVPAPRACAEAQVNDNAAPADVQKRTRGSSRISASADRQFLNEHKALSGLPQFDRPGQIGVPAIVSVSVGSHPSDPLLPPPHTTKTPRHWRDATDEVHAHFALEALRESGPVVAFTAWCSKEISDRAYATGAPLPWLRNRLKKALDGALGLVEWVVGLEEERRNAKLRLHIHGAGAFGDLTRSRRRGIRKAMQRALGAWEGSAARYQVKLKIARDIGWASYCTKRAWLARPGIRAILAGARPGSQWRLSFDGPTLTMTNGVRARAKELHQKARDAVQRAQQRARSAPSPGTAAVPQNAVCESPGPVSGVYPPLRLWVGLAAATSAWFSPPEICASSQPTTAARSRDTSGRRSRASPGPDPPLPERLLEVQGAEHELPVLAVAEGDDGKVVMKPDCRVMMA